LRERCRRALEAKLPWGELWQLIVEHGRYQELVERCAKNAVRRSPLSADWWEDVADDAMIRLTKRLADDVYLEIDPAEADEKYVVRLARVTSNLCRQAVREAVREQQGRILLGEMEHWPDGLDETSLYEFHVDFGAALSKLSDRQRQAIVLRFFDRCSYRRIADVMGLIRRQTEYAVEQALERLRRLMPPLGDMDE